MTVLVALSVVSLIAFTVYNSVHVVEEGEIEALLVYGEFRSVLQPGIHMIPPFVSSVYPIDPTKMLIHRDGDPIEVPEEHRHEVREKSRQSTVSPGSWSG